MQVPGVFKPGGALRPQTVNDSQSALRANRRAVYTAVGLLAAGEVVTTVAMPPVGVFLLGSTGAALFFGRRHQQLTLVEHRRELVRAADQTGDAALTDRLTGLPNRQQFIDQIGREVARAERYAQDVTLAIIQIERLAELEQAWGGATGEKAVTHVAETLGRIVRQSDFLARLDATRFAVVLVGCSREQADAFGERVMLAVSNRPLQARDRGRLPLYVSVGVQAEQYERSRYRGPLDFLSAAGGESFEPIPLVRRSPRPAPEPARAREAVEPIIGGPEPVIGAPAALAGPSQLRTESGGLDQRALRRQLVRDYYPQGRAEDFASAYGRFRRKNAS